MCDPRYANAKLATVIFSVNSSCMHSPSNTAAIFAYRRQKGILETKREVDKFTRIYIFLPGILTKLPGYREVSNHNSAISSANTRPSTFRRTLWLLPLWAEDLLGALWHVNLPLFFGSGGITTREVKRVINFQCLCRAAVNLVKFRLGSTNLLIAWYAMIAYTMI